MKIEGSVALVTGANRGIGKAITTALLDRGAAKVYAAVRDVATVPTDDPRLVPVQLDVTDPAQVRSVADTLGDVEIVVNNAGIGRPATPLTATIDILKAIAGGKGPDRAILALGYAGWRAGQLESEIQANGWLHCPADLDLLFDRNLEQKYDRAMSRIGIDLSHLVSDAGHA